MKLSEESPAPPGPWWKHPPPPPLHHFVRHPPSPPPPPPTDDDSTPPFPSPPPPRASRVHQPPPPPPPDESVSGTSNQLSVQGEKCTHSLSPGGALVPVGAPLSDLASTPTPAPYSGDNNKTLAHTTMVSAMKYNQCTYTIITSTGNIEGGGTQADVNVEFFDKHGSSVLFVNLRSQSRNFNQGATDTFTVVGDCVQSICKMRLSHDDAGPSPGWFVNTVTVSVLYQTHVFNVFEWLAKDEPPYSLSRVVGSCPA